MSRPRRGPTPLLRRHAQFLKSIEQDPHVLLRAGRQQLCAIQEILQNVKMGTIQVPPKLIKGLNRKMMGHALETACSHRTKPARLRSLLRGNSQTGGFPLHILVRFGVRTVFKHLF